MSTSPVTSAPAKGAESVTLDPERVQVAARVTHPYPRLARIGDDDVLLTYVTPSPTERSATSALVSRRIRGAFTAWPPSFDEPVVHLEAVDTWHRVGEVVAWPDGRFVERIGREVVLAQAGRPGALVRFKADVHIGARPELGVYVVEREASDLSVLHRSSFGPEAHVSMVGRLPLDDGRARVVTERGTLISVRSVGGDAAELRALSPGRPISEARVSVPARVRCFDLIARPGGGALLWATADHENVLFALDERGQVEAELFRHPPLFRAALRIAIAPWRSGAALFLSRGMGGLGLIATDASGASFSRETVQGRVIPTVQQGGLVSSADGSVLIAAYSGPEVGLCLARFSCAAGDPAQAFVPAVEARASAAPAQGAAAVQKPPPPPCRFGTHAELSRFFRVLSLANLLQEPPGAMFEGGGVGTLARGTFVLSDGNGHSVSAHWDPTGLVLLGFDSGAAESEWRLELDLREPGKHLVGAPPELAALCERATDFEERLATEGVWIAAGPDGAHRESKDVEQIPELLGLGQGPCPAEMVQAMGSPELDQLVATIAGRDSYVITSEDAEALFASWAEPPKLELEHLDALLESLSKLGVTWPEARVQAAQWLDRHCEEGGAVAYASPLGEAERELFAAAHAGDGERVRAAVAGGAELDVALPEGELAATPKGVTPLLVAMRRGHRALAEQLIEAGADVNASAPARGGVESPLRIAAAQGDRAMVERLLARGASVEPDKASGGLLQAMTYPRQNLAQGSAEDRASVLRLLLDAGAPLPDDAHCNPLARFAEEGGALDLLPRVERVHIEDALPPAIAAVDAAMAPRVSELLSEAAQALEHDSQRALHCLCEAWRLDPDPRIGDVAETLARRASGDLGVIESGARGLGPEATLAALARATSAPADPRAASEILTWLWARLPRARDAIARCEDAAAALLVHTRDVRFVESLSQRCEVGPLRASRKTRASLVAAAKALASIHPLPRSGADREALSRIEDGLAARKHLPGRAAVRDLFEAVYDAPDDDAPRRALGERLRELGDPRGELIELQLTRHATGEAPSAREKELLTERGAAWLGAIAPLVGDNHVFERGFVVQAVLGKGARLGDAGVPLLGTGQGTQREWSTVRRLSMVRAQGLGLLRGSRLRGLRELLDVVSVADLLVGGPRPLERLDLARARNLEWWRGHERHLTAIPDVLPALTRLRFAAPSGLAWAGQIVARLPALRAVALGVQAPLAEVVAWARTTKLERVSRLGLFDLDFDLAKSELSVSLPGRFFPPYAEQIVEALDGARALGLSRLSIRTPPRATLAVAPHGTVFKRRSEELPLRPIEALAGQLGLALAIDPHVDDCFAPDPSRAG